jgi:hypothetical protein
VVSFALLVFRTYGDPVALQDNQKQHQKNNNQKLENRKPETGRRKEKPQSALFPHDECVIKVKPNTCQRRNCVK